MEKIYERKFNENVSGYSIVLLGGSLGEKPIRSVRDLKNIIYFKDEDLLTKEEAITKAKRLNDRLTPGEKKYYRLKYVIAEVIDGKFTGK